MNREINTSGDRDWQPKRSLIKKFGALIGRSQAVLEAEFITHVAAIAEAHEQGITRVVSRLEFSDTIYAMELTQLHVEGTLPVAEMVAPYLSQVRVSVLRSAGSVAIFVAKNADTPNEDGYIDSRYYTVELLPEGVVRVRATSERDAMITGSNLKSANSRVQDIVVDPDSFIATLSEFEAGDPYPVVDDNGGIQPQALLVQHALAAVESYESR